MARTAATAPSSKPRRGSPDIPRSAVYGVGLVPAAWAIFLGLTDQLGAEPIKALEHILGLWSLRFIVLGLVITPLRQLAKVNLLRYRRAIGLLAFFVQSNDLFYAPGDGGIVLFGADGRPVSGDRTVDLALWDAGTEVNQAPGIGADQAPRQKAQDTGTAENGIVRQVSDGFVYPPTGEVIRVTITPRR